MRWCAPCHKQQLAMSSTGREGESMMISRDVALFCLGLVSGIALSVLFAAPPSAEEISRKKLEMEMMERLMPVWCGNDGGQ
jgi:hypothetical protein